MQRVRITLVLVKFTILCVKITQSVIQSNFDKNLNFARQNHTQRIENTSHFSRLDFDTQTITF
jgi:hypothetical protein